MYRYLANGFLIESDVSMPQLPPCTGNSDGVPISIRVDYDAWSKRNFEDGASPYVRSFGAGCIELEHPLHGLMRISSTGISVSVEGRDHWEEASTYVLGTGLALVGIFNGRVPYHMSAVGIAGHGVAFTGDSGAGKTTWAGLAMRHFGLKLLSDDMALVRIAADEPSAYVSGGVMRLRLREDSVPLLSPSKIRLDFQQRIESYDFDSEGSLSRVEAVLSLLPGDWSPGVREFSKAESFGMLRHNQFRRDYGDAILGPLNMVKHAMDLARCVRCYEFRYRLGEEAVPENLKCLRELFEFLSIGAPVSD